MSKGDWDQIRNATWRPVLKKLGENLLSVSICGPRKRERKWPSASLDFESKCFFALDTFTRKKKSWLQDVTIRQGMAKGARELISCWEVSL